MIMRPGVRRLALTVHLAVSMGWVGAVAAYLVLDITVVTSENVQTLRAAYIAMELVAWYAIVPLAFAGLASGLVMSLGTKWGLVRHYWVILSLILTLLAVLVLLVETRTIGLLAAAAADPLASDDEIRALGSTLLHSTLGLVVLVVVLVLNVYKPRGMTRYGWRKHKELEQVRE